jgi:predicted DNA-binding WGR domain protein
MRLRNSPHLSLAGGPFMLRKGGPMTLRKTGPRWPHEAANRHAAEADIKAFEKQLGYALPPSYREFLALHNGWQCFWGSTWISGVSGKALSCIHSRLKEGKKYFLKGAEWNPDRDLVLGADDNGGFLVFSSKVQKNGEREVLDCPSGYIENTFKSFTELLAVQLRCWERDIAKLPKEQRSLPKSLTAKGRRFELESGPSKKFWTVAVGSKDASFTWGRIGTDGQTKTKMFPNTGAMKSEVDALIGEKLKKGYRQVRSP